MYDSSDAGQETHSTVSYTHLDVYKRQARGTGFPASNDPLELAKATLYLPTRRACRLARDMFLDRLDGDAAILPRIIAIGDLDEDEIIFAQTATGDLAAAALELPAVSYTHLIPAAVS